MRIGSVEIATPLALAPMAGVTDGAFRLICAGPHLYGADFLQGPVLPRQEDPEPAAALPGGAPRSGADFRQ